MVKTSFLHMGVTCRDQKKFEEFYTKYFGFTRARTIPLGDNKELIFLKDQGDFYFEVFPMDEEPPLPQPVLDGPHYPGWRHIAFTVVDVDAKLEEMGTDAIVTLGPLSFDNFTKGWKTVWVKDPEGNIVEISQGYKDQ